MKKSAVTVLRIAAQFMVWMMSTRVTEPFGGDIDSTGELTKKPKRQQSTFLGWLSPLHDA
jgi:hypothetical protein